MRIHFIGNRGVSMRALSEFVAARGHTVTGSDRDDGGHAPENVDGCDLVVYTNAVPDDNCELARAHELGIPTVERAEYLGELSRAYKRVIAVAGCHGKSTATAMLGAIFGDRATLHVGVAGGSRLGADDFFITEACEYRESFLHLTPDIGVVLNVQFDHPDYYRDEAALVRAYKAFCARCKTVIVNGDDPVCKTLCAEPITFGLGKDNDYRAENVRIDGGTRTFELASRDRRARITMPVVGEHNVYNALAALAVADACELNPSSAASGLNKFGGIARRFERKGVAFGKTVIVDYAHHPTEIAATLACARELFPSVAVVFQPHTYSRTQSLMDGFVSALAAADTVVLAPVFSARERTGEVSSHTLCRKIVELNERAYCFDTFAEIVDYCKSLKEKAVIFMGAGDIDKAAERFLRASKNGRGRPSVD